MFGDKDDMLKWLQEERDHKTTIKRRYYTSDKGRAYDKARWINKHQTDRPKPDTCDLCKQRAKKIVGDHKHGTDIFRGWLCNRCNLVIGLVDDDIDLLRGMAEYIQSRQ